MSKILRIRRGQANETFHHRFYKIERGAFFTRLQAAGVKRVIDVRLRNDSQLAGFAKKEDLAYFLKAVAGIEYLHELAFAPTDEIMDAMKGGKLGMAEYEKSYRKLLRGRKAEKTLSRETLDDACLLCSEDKPDKCRRRLLAEYLRDKLGDVEIIHL